MSIHAITGVMGSGKSYEAVAEKIVPALRDDPHRRVITNIEGLNYEAIASFVKRPLDEVKARLISVNYERVSAPGFWYDPEGGERDTTTDGPPRVETTAPVLPTLDTVVQPGDLVVLDEVWRYFNRGTKLPDDAMRFFRMHRHYVHAESGHTCDVVLINQALRGIHQDIRDVVEVQFACRKLKVFGRPQNYQVFMHEGGERKASHSYLRKYSSDIFPLYSSYTHKNARESIDKRQSVLSKPFFKFVLPLAFVGIIFGGYNTYRYFSSFGQPAGAPAAEALSAPAGAPGAAPATSGALNQPPGSPAAPGAPAGAQLVASYRLGDITIAVLYENGVYRTAAAPETTVGLLGETYVKVSPAPDGYVGPGLGVRSAK